MHVTVPRGAAALVATLGLSAWSDAGSPPEPAAGVRTAQASAAERPEPVVIERAGRDDCADLPPPPEGVPGLREYARFEAAHDGVVTVRSAQLPFSRNEGFLYRQTPDGWVPNEADFILIRSPLPVRGGSTYVIAFGTGDDRCGAWSIDAVYQGFQP